jgi:Protein of unknown function (DUF3467)
VANPEGDNVHDDDDQIDTEYANNTAIDGTVWDLKIVFGEYSSSSNNVDWHTRVTMPWAAAKLLLLFLESTIAGYEAIYGKVTFPTSMIPPEPPAPADENEQAKAIYDRLMEIRGRFLNSL